MIKEITLIRKRNATEFADVLESRIDELQKRGLRVEIQYKEPEDACCALLIGRKKRWFL